MNNRKKATIEDVSQSVDDVLDTLQGFVAHTGEEFDKINKKLDNLDGRLTKVEQTMVTKDYLDEKMADQRADIMVLFRKSDRKFVTLVEILDNREGITHAEAKRVMAMEPFAK